MEWMSDEGSVNRQAGALLAVAPVHLKSLADICATFGKRRSTIREWYEQGAPIAFDGRQYSAEYNQLQAWIVIRFGSLGGGR